MSRGIVKRGADRPATVLPRRWYEPEGGVMRTVLEYHNGTRVWWPRTGEPGRVEYHTGDVVHFDGAGRVTLVVDSSGREWR